MSMSNKIVYYYQTFTGLDNLLKNNCKTVTHINVSSIHFGKNEDNTNQTPQETDINRILKKGADASFKTTSLKEYLSMVSNIVKNKITNADIESLITNHRFKIVAFKHNKEKIETSIKIKFPNLSDDEISAIYEVISKD